MCYDMLDVLPIDIKTVYQPVHLYMAYDEMNHFEIKISATILLH